jgi:2-amino-4-hydroxy-6-hydroxymethyldihydropteridine diphosphokinase
MTRWRPAYVGLGSNLDRPQEQVSRALRALRDLPRTRLLVHSRLWSSPPLGPPDQPDYVNAVAGLLTRLDARQLLDRLRAIELAMGRQSPAERWGPRIIDLDLLLLAGEVCDEADLKLPHPGVHERDFVLYPLAEFASSVWVPGQGRVAELLRRVGDRGLSVLQP